VSTVIPDLLTPGQPMHDTPSFEIGLVQYPGAQQAAILGLTDLFDVANTVACRFLNSSTPSLRISHWQQASAASTPERVFDTQPHAGSRLSVLILPPTLQVPNPAPPSALVTWLKEQHAQGVMLGSVCAGAFLLAATGLLDGRPMTTHWTYAQLLQQCFPNVQVDTDRLIIDDGDIMTAGGLMAWTDLGLRLIDRLLGPSIMLDTARTLVVDPPGREQRYYSAFSPVLMHGDAAVLSVQHWLQATQAKDMTLATLAAQAKLEPRTLLRRFQKATGMTTTEYGQRLRVGRAREMLQFETASIDRVAWEVGYSDAGAFRKVFTRIVGLTPSAYKRRFSVGLR
jgi:transcriptional regulator GlxA family with amidase domain